MDLAGLEGSIRRPGTGGAHLYTSQSNGISNAKALQRSQFSARDVRVQFPFVPYQCQQVFVERLIEAFQLGQNALLESPTGTGKTLCLLCGALAWQQAYASAVQTLSIGQKQRALTEGITMPGAGRVFLPAVTATAKKVPPQDPGEMLRLGNRVYRYDEPASGRVDGEHGRGSSVGTNETPPQLKAPVIIYASRTHSQLAQVIRELKASGYSPRMVVLGSREQLCVHPTVSKMTGSAKNHACKALTKARKCQFKLQLESVITTDNSLSSLVYVPLGTSVNHAGDGGGLNEIGGTGTGPAQDSAFSLPVMDIEELAALGKQKTVCPYFLTRVPATQAAADLVLVPYNYLIDPAVRYVGLGNVDFRGSVLIFDEAHNIEDVASEAASFELSAANLADCIADLRTALQPCVSVHGGPVEIDSSTLPFALDDAITFLKMLLDFEALIDELELSFPAGHPNALPAEVGLEGRMDSGDMIYTLLSRFNINFATKDVLITLLDAIAEYMVSRDAIVTGGTGRSVSLEVFRTIIERVFRDEQHAQDLVDKYKVVVYCPEKKTGTGGGKIPPKGGAAGAGATNIFSMQTRHGRTLAYWCFSPSVSMNELMALGVRSVVLASGTLTPMDSYASELRIPFPVRLENPHVIGSSQLYAAVLSRGATGVTLNSSYEFREKPEYKRELGATIVNLIRLVPDGLLVFFASYGVMESCISFWKADSGGRQWAAIEGSKTPIVEPRGAAEFAQAITAFNTAVDSKRGAVLFAVCRGKVSEGIDFADARGRAVIVTGLPYPPRGDPKVALKRRYLDDARVKASKQANAVRSGSGNVDAAALGLSGGAWYGQQAYRAVNQAIGRVIRHRHDYGAILLLDERFAQPGSKASISAWIRPHLSSHDNMGGIVRALAEFFKVAARDAGARQAEMHSGMSVSGTGSGAGATITPVYSAMRGAVEPVGGGYIDAGGGRGGGALLAPISVQPVRGTGPPSSSIPVRYDPLSAEASLHAMIEQARKPLPSFAMPASVQGQRQGLVRPPSLLDALNRPAAHTAQVAHKFAPTLPVAHIVHAPVESDTGAGAKQVNKQAFGLGQQFRPPVAPAPSSLSVPPALPAPPAPAPAPPRRSTVYMSDLKEALGRDRHARLSADLKRLEQEINGGGASDGGVRTGENGSDSANGSSGAPHRPPDQSQAAAAGGKSKPKGVVPQHMVRALVITLCELLDDAGVVGDRRQGLVSGFMDFMPPAHRASLETLAARISAKRSIEQQDGVGGAGGEQQPKKRRGDS